MLAIFCAASGQSVPAKSDADRLPDGPGKALVVKTCLTCHSVTTTISKQGSTEEEWANVVGQMIGKGAVLSDDEADQVIDYLTAHFGPGTSSDSSPAPAAPDTTAAETAPGATKPSSSAGSGATVNVNKAGADQLQSVLGLSKQEAEAIVQYREQHGDFKSWQEFISAPCVPLQKIKDKQNLIAF
jgi:competence ComEA-like helix-hairpin-helix protein